MLNNKIHQSNDEENSEWRKVLLARDRNRFKSLDLLNNIFHSFFELHGDRLYGDDKAIVGGLAFLRDIPVTVICQQKGKEQEEMRVRQYGMSMPEGYRKSLRLMKQAEKFRRPVVCLIDTPGAFPGIGAEERGQAEAIAKNLYEMSCLTVPIVSVIVSEGGSGGALALAVADNVIMLENAIFSVVSPEGCASILWKASSLAPKAAQYLKLSANNLKAYGIIDKIIEEDGSEEHIGTKLTNHIYSTIVDLQKLSPSQLVYNRRMKFRSIGECN